VTANATDGVGSSPPFKQEGRHGRADRADRTEDGSDRPLIPAAPRGPGDEGPDRGDCSEAQAREVRRRAGPAGVATDRRHRRVLAVLARGLHDAALPNSLHPTSVRTVLQVLHRRPRPVKRLDEPTMGVRRGLGARDTSAMRRLLCVLVGHRPGPPQHVMGMTVRSCTRCGAV